MIEMLPWYYRKSQVVKDLYDVIAAALERLGLDISELDRDLFIATAADFTRHEADVGLIPVSADAETKRARVITRLQGNNLLTLSELERLVTDYEKTGCSIEEDYKNYTVTIIFSGRKGMPSNIDQIQAAIEELKPAHIKINYVSLQNTWTEVRQKLGTWGNAKQFTWGGIKEYNGSLQL